MSCFGQKVSYLIVPHLRLLSNPSSYVPGYSTAHQGQGLLKFLRDTSLVLTESRHICAGGQKPWHQLEKQHHISSRKWVVFAWLSLNSPKHSGYLLTVFKKGKFQFSVSNRLPCSLCINHSQHKAQVLSGMCIHHPYTISSDWLLPSSL